MQYKSLGHFILCVQTLFQHGQSIHINRVSLASMVNMNTPCQLT